MFPYNVFNMWSFFCFQLLFRKQADLFQTKIKKRIFVVHKHVSEPTKKRVKVDSSLHSLSASTILKASKDDSASKNQDSRIIYDVTDSYWALKKCIKDDAENTTGISASLESLCFQVCDYPLFCLSFCFIYNMQMDKVNHAEYHNLDSGTVCYCAEALFNAVS